MTSVQAINASQTFTANPCKSKDKYTGTIIGAGVAATMSSLALCVPANKGVRLMAGLKTLARTIPLFAGVGLLVDYLNNKQRKSTQPNAKTDKGNDYVKVNNGKKYGALLGVVAPLVMKIFNNNKVQASLGVKIAALPFMLIGAGVSALCGYGLGALTDKLDNSQAIKDADNVA